MPSDVPPNGNLNILGPAAYVQKVTNLKSIRTNINLLCIFWTYKKGFLGTCNTIFNIIFTTMLLSNLNKYFWYVLVEDEIVLLDRTCCTVGDTFRGTF